MKVCSLLVDRANYGRLKPVLIALEEDSDIEHSLICSGTMVLDRFGQAASIVESDGIFVAERIYMEVEGSVGESMAKSLGLGVIEFTSALSRIKPDILLVIGDRYEALACVLASSYLGIPVAHIQGGEVSGAIDECARHAISKFSHLHFPSTERSAKFLIKLGEKPDAVFNFGCPSGDYILRNFNGIKKIDIHISGVGANVDFKKEYILVMFHPDTTSKSSENLDFAVEIYNVVKSLNMQVVWLWPNIDAGSDSISKFLRTMRENDSTTNEWLRVIKNLKPEDFQLLLSNAKVAIGNSSSFVRDSSFTGVPVVLTGNRQIGREYSDNVLLCSHAEKLAESVNIQINAGSYASSNLYGDGNATVKIISVLKSFDFQYKKVLNYIYE